MTGDKRIFIVDAFTRSAFKGNPAAVCPVQSMPDEALMQQIAAEMNLSETAFVEVEKQAGPSAWAHLRWFTPTVEVPLCGHATLAAASVLFGEVLDQEVRHIYFRTLSGELVVRRDDDGKIVMNFPLYQAQKSQPTPEVLQSFSFDKDAVVGCFDSASFHVLQLKEGTDLKQISVDASALAKCRLKEGQICLAITAKGPEGRCDFQARVFAPWAGIDEDPVTGSAYTVLGPLWAEELGKKQMHAEQLSARGGELELVILQGGRIEIKGWAREFMRGSYS